jgi:23S rRNA maturation-related 3'-5' exoribonuclease YhaM
VLAFAGLDMTAHAANVAQLTEWRNELEAGDTLYAPVLTELLANGAFEALCMAAGAVKMHHANPGGLAQHLVEVGRGGLALLDSTGAAYDRAYFLAGVFCHDIGKLDTYTAPPTIAYTAQGLMGEHQIFSTFRLGKACAAVGATKTTEAKLVHIIEQAHGSHRHAEWQDPLGVECKALAAADIFSSRLHETDKERTAQGLLDGLADQA